MPRRKRLPKEIREFSEELRNRLADFIIGALSFVAAFSWRDAIQYFTNMYIENIKAQTSGNLDPWMVPIVSAIAVTFVAVFGIYIVSKLLKKK